MTTKPSYTPALRFPDFLNDGQEISGLKAYEE